MALTPMPFKTLLAFAAIALAGCSENNATPAVDAGPTEAGAACAPCTTDTDCTGGICAQLGSDSYCVRPCPNGNECASGDTCLTVATVSGESPRGCVSSACGSPVTDAGTVSCPGLAGPNEASSCKSCSKTSPKCQTNGCYGGWYCNTLTAACQPPPTSCASGPDGGAPVDPGPVQATIGPNGGTESQLYFAIMGDTRPAFIDDTKGYPTTIITKLYQGLAQRPSVPPFVVSTGDYIFASVSGNEAAPQFAKYLSARSGYAGTLFPALGNHECTGATVSNCGAGGVDGITTNYSQFLATMLAPIQKTLPYYEVDVDAQDASWTSKFLFVAANAWDATQATWLDGAMAKVTTYTFIIRHESAQANTAPGVKPSEAIMAAHPYTLAIVGHTHTYDHPRSREIIVGNGGAPLTGGKGFGFGLITQRTDKALQVDMVDIVSGLADTTFRFAIRPDGTPAP